MIFYAKRTSILKGETILTASNSQSYSTNMHSHHLWIIYTLKYRVYMIPKSILSYNYAENGVEEEGIIKKCKRDLQWSKGLRCVLPSLWLGSLLVPLQNCSRKPPPSDMGVFKLVVPLSLMNMKCQKSLILMNEPLFIANQPYELIVEINSP